MGTPRGRLSQYEQKLAGLPWQVAREGVSVKLLPEDKELYVLAESKDRVNKERAMRRRQLKGLWPRLKKLQAMKLKRDELLKKLGAALHDYPAAARLIDTAVAPRTAATDLRPAQRQTAPGAQTRRPLSAAQQHHRRTFARGVVAVLHSTDGSGSRLQKPQGRLGLRPICHQLERRIEAHIFISFLAYCLHVTLRRRLRDLAPGLTPRSVLEKFATIQMLDVHLPTTDERTVILSRYTHPETDVQLLLQRLKLELPAQPPPKITAPKPPGKWFCSEDLEKRSLICRHLRSPTPSNPPSRANDIIPLAMKLVAFDVHLFHFLIGNPSAGGIFPAV